MLRIGWMVFPVLFVSCSGGTEGTSVVADVVVLVQPIGEVPSAQLDSVAIALRREHGVQVGIAGPIALPQHAFVNVRSPRYKADTLIAWLSSIRPDTADLVIGVTGQDISTTKFAADGKVKEPHWKYIDFGIFGLAYVGGRSSVVSTFRLGDMDDARSIQRLMKIAVHEVGHNRSLLHCDRPECVMRDAVERISSIDEAGEGLCPACAARAKAR